MSFEEEINEINCIRNIFSELSMIVLVVGALLGVSAAMLMKPSEISNEYIEENEEILRRELETHRFGFIIGHHHSGLTICQPKTILWRFD